MIIEIQSLVKRYGNLVALDHFNLEVSEGEIVGLLGPNGSGKTTLINCVLSLLKYDKGTIRVFGKEMRPDAYDIKQRIGIVMQNVAVFRELRVDENVDYFCGLYVKDAVSRRQLVDEAIDFVELDAFRKFYPRKLSGGLLRRLNIACGIVHKPELLILDEPTVGVDPQSRNSILEGIRELNRQGTTVLYTSHYMEEVEQLCNRVVIMDQGKPLATGTIEELKAMVNSGETVVVEIYKLESEDLDRIQQLPNVSRAYYEDDHLTVHFDGGLHNLLNLLDYLKSREISFNRVFSQQPTLNDVFLEITGKQLENEEDEEMFGHVFSYRLKCLVRDRDLVFWTLIFSILLGTMFHVAFGHLTTESEKFQPIEVAVVDNEDYRNDPSLQAILEELSSAGQNRMLDLVYADEKGAEELLNEGAVSGIITAGEPVRLTVKEPGIYQSILKMILDEHLQTTKTVANIISRNPQVVSDLIEGMQSENGYRRDYTEQISFSGVVPNMNLVYFYALLAMACMYSGFWGLRNAIDIQADLSDLGARRSVAPTHKMVVVLADSAAALVISFSEILILLAYLSLALGVKFGSQIGYVLLTCLAGCIAGVSYGSFIGTLVRGHEGVKTGILIGSTMAMSFLAGLMWVDMKYIVSVKVPFLSYINPAALIADAFYSLYVFDTHRRFFINIGMLCLISAVFCVASFAILRRDEYASI